MKKGSGAFFLASSHDGDKMTVKMARPLRISKGGYVYHVLNRANGRAQVFFDAGDYQAFDQVLCETHAQIPIRILSYCVMPNHWHLVLWPGEDGELSKFMALLTMTHAQRWNACHHTVGCGHLYQGRFKSFPIQNDHHFLKVCRYVERNPLRSNLVFSAEEWLWSSLWRRSKGNEDAKKLLSFWPVACPDDWLELVNQPQTEEEEKALRQCILRGQPFGTSHWVDQCAGHLGLQSALRPRGRPKKGS
jgi:putative transposase